MDEKAGGGALHSWIQHWWRGEAGAVGAVVDLLLWPAESAYRAITGLRNSLYDRGTLRAEVAGIPVISVGNLGVGGAGKTPVSAWIAGRLREWGRNPCLVLRGYGEDEVNVHRELNPAVPVVVGARRAAAVAQGARQGCDVAVVDDGFQHRALARDLDLVLISADSWTARRRLLPRGAWRESLGALRRADAAIVTRKAVSRAGADEIRGVVARTAPKLPLAICAIQPGRLVPLHGGPEYEIETLAGAKVLAVASLADPRPFAQNLREAGAEVELLAFPDHHEYLESEAEEIVRICGTRTLLMTRKDAVKLRLLLSPEVHALVLDQVVRIEEGGDLLDAALRRALLR